MYTIDYIRSIHGEKCTQIYKSMHYASSSSVCIAHVDVDHFLKDSGALGQEIMAISNFICEI